MISTHILDTSLGQPARGVSVKLEFQNSSADKDWKTLAEEKTNSDGRISFQISQADRSTGIYRLSFAVESYFRDQNIDPFFLMVPVSFKVSDIGRSYHVPLLLNPFGYSTYRGS
jgi:5-hydroxyisourate hydrolase